MEKGRLRGFPRNRRHRQHLSMLPVFKLYPSHLQPTNRKPLLRNRPTDQPTPATSFLRDIVRSCRPTEAPRATPPKLAKPRKSLEAAVPSRGRCTSTMSAVCGACRIPNPRRRPASNRCLVRSVGVAVVGRGFFVVGRGAGGVGIRQVADF